MDLSKIRKKILTQFFGSWIGQKRHYLRVMSVAQGRAKDKNFPNEAIESPLRLAKICFSLKPEGRTQSKVWIVYCSFFIPSISVHSAVLSRILCFELSLNCG